MAGHVRLELGNVVANYPFERSLRFLASQQIPASRVGRGPVRNSLDHLAAGLQGSISHSQWRALGMLFDASAWRGIELDVFGNDEEYNIHLRIEGLTRPWQSYRQSFRANPRWRTFKFQFQDFTPYRIDTTLDTRRLRRVGLVAIGRAFSTDLSVGGLRYLA
jgi:complex I intermediate-associated protein 30 (CIA30)